MNIRDGLVIFCFLFSNYVFSQTPNSIFKAQFVYGQTELDSFVVDNFVRPNDCLEFGIDFDIWMQFTVDSLSQISFVKVLDIKVQGKWSDSFKSKIDSLKPQLRQEAVRVINATAGFWIPKEINGKYTWEIVDYRMEVRTPEFTKNREAYLRTPLNSINSHVYNNYVDIPADNPVKYYNLGVKKVNQKRYHIAIKYFQKSLQLGNINKDVYYNLGVAQYLYDEKDKACASWHQAVKLGDEEAQSLIDKNCQ